MYSNGNPAVSENTFCVKKGEVFGLLGPNGAGKSTLFNLMTMDLRRTSGNIKLMNQEIDNIDITEMGSKMGMCPQSNSLWGVLTVDQCIDFIGQVKGLSREQIDF